VPPGYTIVGGLTDAQRLARQAQMMAGATHAFLSRLGLATGWQCLDVGCGEGHVTIAMARLAGPSGHVVGVDIDVEALGLAREAAECAGVSAEFERADADRPVASEAFDVAYSRLLLSHLVDPAAVVRAMCAAVRPGGDPTIGARLPALLSASGLEGASILDARAATDGEIDELEASIERAAREPATVFYQARIHQVSGRRPSD
jgi:ubiquinone/menaquinone biosynthesis C-methylase UbiE